MWAGIPATPVINWNYKPRKLLKFSKNQLCHLENGVFPGVAGKLHRNKVHGVNGLGRGWFRVQTRLPELTPRYPHKAWEWRCPSLILVLCGADS